MTTTSLRILTMGDSIADQGNAFRRQQGKSIRHEGHSGFSTADLKTQVALWIENSQPDVVLLMIGTNDVWRKMSLTKAIENINEIAYRIFSTQPQADLKDGIHPNALGNQ